MIGFVVIFTLAAFAQVVKEAAKKKQEEEK